MELFFLKERNKQIRTPNYNQNQELESISRQGSWPIFPKSVRNSKGKKRYTSKSARFSKFFGHNPQGKSMLIFGIKQRRKQYNFLGGGGTGDKVEEHEKQRRPK